MEKNLDAWTPQQARDELAEHDSLVAQAGATGREFRADPEIVAALASRSQGEGSTIDRKYGCPLSAMLSSIETEREEK